MRPMLEHEDQESSHVYRAYPYRWVVLTVFSLASFAVGNMITAFSPVAPIIEDVYNVSNQTINLTFQVYLFVYVPAVMFANYMMESCGLYLSLLVAVILNSAGAWLRLLISVEDAFVWAIIGQLIAGIANPFVLSAPPKISVLWFPKEQQNVATVLGSMTYPLGAAFSFILPSLFLKDADKTNPAAGHDHMRQYIIVQSIIVTATSIVLVIFFRSKPPTPPTATAVIDRSNFCQGAKQLVCNGNYWVLTIAFMFYWSLYVSMGVIISQITDLYNYPNSATAVIGAVYILVGFIGSNLYTGLVFSKVKRFKKPIFIMMLISFAFLVATYFTFKPGHTWLLTLMISLAMAHLMPCFPMFLELACEIAYPVSESTICGFIQIPVQFFSAGLVSLVSLFVDKFKDKPYLSYIVLLIDYALGVVMVLFIKERMKRSEAR